MEVLIQHGASAHHLAGEKWSTKERYKHPVVYAAFKGHADAVQWLLKHGPNQSAMGEALKEAAAAGHISVARMLTDQGLDMAAYGPQAIRAAQEAGRADVAELLLAAAG
jgi:hypothetical protein